MLRVTGTVCEVVRPIVRWRAKVAGEVRANSRDGEVVVEHDGERVRVRADGRDLVGELRRERLAWSELVERFGLALGTIPPFSEVELEIIELAVATPIALAGEVTELGFDDDGGLRDAPTTRPREVRAAVIAIGLDAGEQVDRELAARERKRTRTPGAAADADRTRWYERALGAIVTMSAVDVAELVMIAIAGALFVIAGVVAYGASDIRPAVGFACGVLALAVALRPSQQLQPFRARENVHGRVLHLDPIWRCVAFAFGVFPLAMGLGIATGAVPTGPGGDKQAGAVIAMFGLLSIAACAIGELVAAPTVRRLAQLTRGAALEGVIRVTRPVTLGGRDVVLGRTEHWDTAWAYSNNKRTNVKRMISAQFSAVPAFTVETDAGTVAVDTKDVAWASTTRLTHKGTGSGWQIITLVPVDARVVVHGARTGNTLRSQGTAPVLLFAGPRDPKRWARRAVRWRWFVRVVLAGSAVGLVWASGWLSLA